MMKNDQKWSKMIEKMKKTNSQKTHIIFKILKIRFLSDLKSTKSDKNDQKKSKIDQKQSKIDQKQSKIDQKQS